MKKMRLKAQTHGRQSIQVFACGPFEFHVGKALKLASGGKYHAERRWPSPEWIGPFIEINEQYIEQADVEKPVLFATLVTDGRPWHLLIDGNHRVLKALRQGLSVEAITLDLGDTLKIVRGSPHDIEQMRRDGIRLGLLR